MPSLTRWFIKMAMISLMLALVARAAIIILPVLNVPAAAALSPVFTHLFIWGWATQLIFGVAYWMFPKYSQEKPHGHEGLWIATFWLFNIGLILRVVGEPMNVLRPEVVWDWLTTLSAVLQWLAAIIFVGNTWGRVKGR